MRYGADMAFEVGKNRLEALGEVEEAADLIRYYAQTAEDNAFYDHKMGDLGDWHAVASGQALFVFGLND